VAGDLRQLHTEELHNLYASPDIRVIKSRGMRAVGHVVRMEYEKYIQNCGRQT